MNGLFLDHCGEPTDRSGNLKRLSSITLPWFAVGRQVFAAEEERDIVGTMAVFIAYAAGNRERI